MTTAAEQLAKGLALIELSENRSPGVYVNNPELKAAQGLAHIVAAVAMELGVPVPRDTDTPPAPPSGGPAPATPAPGS